jgi:hypothetical protein
MSLVSRLIKSLKVAIECKRLPSERLGMFATRFWGLACTHLVHARASQDSKLGEMLAIVLINNAKLSTNAIASAKLELIRVAESPSLTLSAARPVAPGDQVRLKQKGQLRRQPVIESLRKSSKFISAVALHKSTPRPITALLNSAVKRLCKRIDSIEEMQENLVQFIETLTPLDSDVSK